MRRCAQRRFVRGVPRNDVSLGHALLRTREDRASRLDDAGVKRAPKQRWGYTEAHAKSGVTGTLPAIETWLNQYKGYEIEIEVPEYTAMCPKTGLPDFGTIRIRYMPDKACLELKSLKLYIYAYRNLGIFYENAVNRILQDIVAACRPVWIKVTGEFTARGGLRSTIEAKYP
ncbi:MAG: NADPH-dependent 7-cyano-7-deazaguanine reductase QueF [Nitrospira sp.]|nr:NADPH-dependent 7-cyano-7-deazaguanine reductase QueF [Nitrospira sp.]